MLSSWSLGQIRMHLQKNRLSKQGGTSSRVMEALRFLGFVLAALTLGGGVAFESAAQQGERLAPSRLVTPPDGSNRSTAVQIFPNPGVSNTRYMVLRDWPSGVLDTFTRESHHHPWVRLDLDATWRRNTHPLLIQEDGERLLMVSYDSIRSLPGGRVVGEHRDGLDLYEITPSLVKPKLLADGLPIGGIESIPYLNAHKDGVTICASASCFTVDKTGKSNVWERDALAGQEIVEAVVYPDRAIAILRPIYDDRLHAPLVGEEKIRKFSVYSIADWTPAGAKVTTLARDSIPYAPSLQNGMPQWKTARTRSELRTLFAHELQRRPLGGLLNFGANNLEGRIAWGQVYYLNGLMSLAATSAILPALSHTTISRELRPRIEQELELTARLALTAYPELRAKRYSVEREPLLFALHLGRTARMFEWARYCGFTTPSMPKALARIQQDLLSLTRTVEAQGPVHHDGKSYPGMHYRRGMPFWADGADLPYNYITGYVHGLLSHAQPSAAVKRNAALLLNPILEIEKPHQKSLWRYWWGSGFSGWSQPGFSANTPHWPGHQAGSSPAHVTYRSIDVMALLAMERHHPGFLPKDAVSAFQKQLQDGWLLPFVNEELFRIGKTARLPQSVAYLHARSAADWELEAQVWALEALAQDAPE